MFNAVNGPKIFKFKLDSLLEFVCDGFLKCTCFSAITLQIPYLRLNISSVIMFVKFG